MADIAFEGSVIKQDGDRTTIAIQPAGPSASDMVSLPGLPSTITVGAATYVAYQALVSDILEGDDTTVTVSLACERANTKAVPTCTVSTAGIAELASRICTAVVKTDGPYAPGGSQDFCAAFDGNEGPVQTSILSGDAAHFLNEFPLTITSGTEKLSAAATTSASGASVTGSGSAAPASGSVSGSGIAASTGSQAASAASASASASKATGAAASIHTMVPALAGMGAAVAAFFL